MSKSKTAHAFAPGSVGNIGVGFDLFGHTIQSLHDEAIVSISAPRGVRVRRIGGDISGLETIPHGTETNTAARALQALINHLDLPFGFDLELIKHIPLNAGLGGSAASAVAALVAANALLDEPLRAEALIPLAMEGEFASSHSYQADNVAPMLLGGVVLATADECIRFDVPSDWTAVVVHPHMELSTRDSRAVLHAPYPLADIVRHGMHLTQFVLGLERGDPTLLRKGLKDVLVEPRRAALIPHFADVQQTALGHAAMGCSISGAGPSVFAWFESPQQAERGRASMQAAFQLETDAWVVPINGIAAALK